MRKVAANLGWSLALLLITVGHVYAAPPVHINFENLPVWTVVSNQYQGVTFSSSDNFFYPITVVSSANCFCAASSYPNYIVSYPAYGYREVYLDFTNPVKNLSFYVIASDSLGLIGKIDVFQNGTLSGTHNIFGNGNPYVPIFYNGLSSLTNVTRIRIYAITDAAGLGFDDFDFTPVDVERVDITNPRVSGVLNGTTQNAMLGANVTLQANINPTGLTGGTYSWYIAAPYQLVSGTINSPSLTIYWTQPGTYAAQVTYTRNGVSVSGTVNVNVVTPTLTDFSATQNEDLLGEGGFCGEGVFLWSLGCSILPGAEGINFSASVQIPSLTYLSDPAQSGIKYVQAVSTVRKYRFESGTVNCLTGRSGEHDINSGWRIDNDAGSSGDPYENTSRPFATSLKVVH